MPNTDSMFAAYLRKEDIEPFGAAGHDVTINDVRKDSILSNGEEIDKWFMDLGEFPHPLVLNKTNADEVAEILGSKDTEDWGGKMVNLFVDHDIQFKGSKVGGLRLRACNLG